MGAKFILLVDFSSVPFSHGLYLAVPKYTPGRCGADYRLEQEAQFSTDTPDVLKGGVRFDGFSTGIFLVFSLSPWIGAGC